MNKEILLFYFLLHLLEIRQSLQLGHRDERGDLPVDSEHTCSLWRVGKHSAWWERSAEITTPAVVWLMFQTGVLPCLKHSVNFSVIHWAALTPNLVPKFLSKGDGDPPYSTKKDEWVCHPSRSQAAKVLKVPAAGVPTHWSCSQRHPSPLPNTADRWNL